MASSVVEICNMALAKLGANMITSLADDSAEAIICNLFYEDIRDGLLREHAWNFAEKRVSLALLSTTPAFGFSLAYALPSDCVHARHLSTESSNFKVSGKEVHTDVESAMLSYTSRIIDPTFYDPNFVQALYGRLGAEICENVTGSSGKVQQMVALYQEAMAKAQASDAAEGNEESEAEDEWLTARE